MNAKGKRKKRSKSSFVHHSSRTCVLGTRTWVYTWGSVFTDVSGDSYNVIQLHEYACAYLWSRTGAYGGMFLYRRDLIWCSCIHVLDFRIFVIVVWRMDGYGQVAREGIHSCREYLYLWVPLLGCFRPKSAIFTLPNSGVWIATIFC